MTTADKLRAIIKEEVRKAIRQEIKQIIKESQEPTSNYASSIEKQVKSKVTQSNKQKKNVNPPNFGNNPFANMLQETAMSFSTEDVHSFGGGGSRVSLSEPMGSNARVGSVNDMLSSAKPSSNLDMVNIDTVPDFTGLMNKLKEKGQI